MNSPSQESLKNLNREIKAVESHIKLPPECSQANRGLVQKVLEQLVQNMRLSNELFNYLFQEISYQGSYFDGLRIKEATEFDLNIVLSFQRKLKIKLMVISDLKPPGFGKMMMEKSPDSYGLTPKLLSRVKSLVDKDNYLEPDKINNFMQSAVSTGLNQGPISVPGVQKVCVSSSGPARTLYIHTKSGQRIDLDLVPVFAFGAREIPQGLKLPTGIKFDENDKTWFMVPKPYKKGVLQNPREPQVRDIPRLWRMHFPGIERKIMLDKKSVKPLIKILKLLRDEQGWCALASYYLKTVVMWQVLKNPTQDYWSDNNMSLRFLEILTKLEEYVERGKLSYLLFPEYNLFCNIGSVQLGNIQNRLTKIKKDIENNPEKILVYCKVR